MEDFLTVKDIAGRYGVTVKTIRRWITKVGHDLGQRLDKQGTFGYTEDEITLIAEAGGREPIAASPEIVDAELIEDEGTLTLQSGVGMRLDTPTVGKLSIGISFDTGSASSEESRAITKIAETEVNNLTTALGFALGESIVREAKQRYEIATANLTNNMVKGAQTAVSSQGVASKEAA
ncbi:hypothetical protein N836_35805 [Leptolyngbya sp. Heron Island J]|uniref:hypothetical protein n=1 Tax=Leptolyngbya sp. Heron Island J TaxID=1385935 RepID=UPI0003B9F81E|nr:hypothetical protein [Leptolyngbya sp. Heron Island J]ESA37740.1 hypothetical protein N836_35805 [Leptolyngbya sp. Heron Island J]